MPRTIKAYACEFRCGTKVQTRRARMARHESRCPWNPEIRSCPTCEHDDKNIDEEQDHDCKIDALPEGKQLIRECESYIPDTKGTS